MYKHSLRKYHLFILHNECGSFRKSSKLSGNFIVILIIIATTDFPVPSSVSKCGALAPEWRFGNSLWRQKLSQAPRKLVFSPVFYTNLKNYPGK